MKDLNEKLQAARESARSARSKEKSLKGELDRLTSDLQACKRERKRLQDERKEREEEMQELQQRNSTFKSALQVRSRAAKSRAARRRHEGSFNLADLWQGSSDSSKSRSPSGVVKPEYQMCGVSAVTPENVSANLLLCFSLLVESSRQDDR